MMIALLATAALADLAALDTQVAAVANAQGRVGMPIDRRLRLAACPEAVVVEPADAQSIGVRCASLGWRIRVRTEGGAASPAALASGPVVRRGDPVVVRVSGSGFAVDTAGVAAEDGAQGRTIRVRIDDGKRQVSGVVTGAGEIAIAG